jgi:tetratricopeptide (TPR) repeat protein
MELALREEPDSPPILFSLAQIAYQTKQLPVAEDYLKRFLALPEDIQRDNAPAHLFLAQIAEDRGRPDDAIEWLAQVTRGEQLLPAVVRRALLLGKTGRVDAGRELLRNTSVPTSRERSS